MRHFRLLGKIITKTSGVGEKVLKLKWV